MWQPPSVAAGVASAAVAVAAAGLGAVDLPGDTAFAAFDAADPTPFADRLTAPRAAPPTELAADPAAVVAIDAIRAAIEATSDAASAACFERLATSLRPFEPWAAASCRSRFASVLRAAARRFSSLCNSLAALFESGVTTPLASTMTSVTVSMTTPVRLLPGADPSSTLAIDRPPFSDA